MIREDWFKNHIAEYFISETKDIKIQLLKWKEPETSVYFVKYILDYNSLFIKGDIGEAAFCWNNPVSFKNIANMDLNYFAQKCVASEKGKDFTSWNPQLAKERLKEESGISDSLKKQLLNDVEDLGDWKFIIDRMYSDCDPEGGAGYIIDNYGYLINIGMEPHIRLKGYLEGIKMANEQGTFDN
jgi:hypothetical protein